MRNLRLTTVVGARPQFVKAATVSRALAARGEDAGIVEQLVHTGQHYDRNMSDVFFEELGIPAPAAHLECGSAPHGVQTAMMMEKLDPLLDLQQPDAVLVYGDTNSTLAAALVAAKKHIPVVHVEAGLRSFDMRMPEEINRRLTDHVATLLMCPSQTAAANLAAEGIAAGVEITGDVMYDAVVWQRGRVEDADAVLDRHGVSGKPFALATVHRAENTDDEARLASIMAALAEIAAGGLDVILPLHPRTARAMGDGPAPSGVRFVKPLGHGELLTLAAAATVGLTDSGGLQKELYWLGTPCVTLRDTTEWPETVEAGWNRLVGADSSAIVAAVSGMTGLDLARPPLYGEGDAAEKVIDAVLQWWRQGGSHE